MVMIQITLEQPYESNKIKSLAAEMIDTVAGNLACSKSDVKLIIRQQDFDNPAMENIFTIWDGKESVYRKAPTYIF